MPHAERQPMTDREACEFVGEHHRHNRPPQCWIFSKARNNGKKIVGVAIVGRPVACMLDDGQTLELTRLCANGTTSVSSKLPGAVRRTAFALGYKRVGGYPLECKGGVMLRTAIWKLIGEAVDGSWSRKIRPQEDKQLLRRSYIGRFIQLDRQTRCFQTTAQVSLGSRAPVR